ncbi:chaperone protein ClpB1-like isoform X2 [Cornus florida]|uniref:chaperone protein ClpB1-like isoform X2 n=1 Tax=Cornus florida TaxID=4283 RepID=UPI00289A2876|nr:chaperone protein ClpB1-like isoform X2 [Cornus florida]
MADTRLQMREIASSTRTQTGKRLILYPSDAALRYMLGKSKQHKMGGRAMRIWLEENLVPLLSDMLANNERDDMSTVYIDKLVGQHELSYRSEKGGYQAENLFMKLFKESLRGLRAMYLKEKERVNKIYLLRRNLFELMNLPDAEDRTDLDSVAEVARALVKTLDALIKNAVDINLMALEQKMVHSNSLNEKVEHKLRETLYKSSKNGVQGLPMRLTRMVRQNQATDVVVEALLKSIDAQHDLPHRPAMSFLFLGLTKAGEADLVDCLAEHLVADNGMNLLIKIDLSEYREPDSLCRFLNGPLEIPNGHEQGGLSLLGAVRMRPHSILFFSEVEKAHMSIFSALLSILDNGNFSINGGDTVDFKNTIVIFASDLGNKAILPRLVGHPDQGSVWDGAAEQEKRGFRFELLNRMDEIVFFDPLAREQLRKVARVSMRAGPHLENKCPLTFSWAFYHLFNTANDQVYKEYPSCIDQIVSLFAEGFINERVTCGMNLWKLCTMSI